MVSYDSTEDYMALDETATVIITALAVVIVGLACGFVLYAMKKRVKKPAVVPAVKEPLLGPAFVAPASPFKVSKSVASNDAVQAKNELRILDLEREILGDAIRHLYEAHAEGKITEEEREKLAASYKQRMMAVKQSMAKDETIVALHELEGMQEDLMKMFSERFGELNGKVEELRSRIDVKPVKEIKVQMPRPPAPVPDQLEKEEPVSEEPEDKTKKPPKKPPTERKVQKTEAEQRIDAIRNQIDEVMNKLGQMEIES
jgi:hypothetical protein